MTLVGIDGHVTAVHGKGLLCLDAVSTLGCDIHCAAGNGHITLAGIRAGGLNAVAGGGCQLQIQCGIIRILRITDPNGILAPQAVIHCIDGHRTIPDLQIILADNAVLVIAVNDQRALAFDLQIILGINSTAIAVRIGIVGTIRNGTGGTVLGSDPALVSNACNINRRIRRIGQLYAVQHQLYNGVRIGCLIHVHHDLPAGHGTGYIINTRLGDGCNGAAGQLHALAGYCQTGAI